MSHQENNFGIPNANREKKCRILNPLAKDMKANKIPSLSKHHKNNIVSWVKKYIKTDFSIAILQRNVELNSLDMMAGPEVRTFIEIVNQHDLDDNRCNFEAVQL